MGEPTAATEAPDAEMGDGLGVADSPLDKMQKQMMASFSTMLATALAANNVTNNVVLGTAIDNKLESELAPSTLFKDGRCSLEAPPKMQERYRMMGAIIRFCSCEKPSSEINVNWSTLIATPKDTGLPAIGVSRTALKVKILDFDLLGPTWTTELVQEAIEYGMQAYQMLHPPRLNVPTVPKNPTAHPDDPLRPTRPRPTNPQLQNPSPPENEKYPQNPLFV